MTNNLSVSASFVAVNLAPPVIMPGLKGAGGNFNCLFSDTPGQHYRVGLVRHKSCFIIKHG